MLTFLTGKKQKTIAWFLFVLFYGDMIAAAHASAGNFYAIPVSANGYSNYSSAGSNNLPNTIRVIKASPISKTYAKQNALTKKDKLSAKDNYSSLLKADAFLKAPLKGTIGGPGQPEMSTFKSVGADNMVNLFTGDFSYNIPLLDVDGYPVNIFYNAGPSMDQEASWVGLGWNINPGAISRNMRGIPDDFNGDDHVTKVQSIKPEISVGFTGTKSKEIIGIPVDGVKVTPGLSKSLSVGLFYNSKRGLGMEFGLANQFSANKMVSTYAYDEKTDKDVKSDIDLKMFKQIGVSVNVNSQTGVTKKLTFAKNLWKEQEGIKYGTSTSIDFNSRTGLGDLRIEGERVKYQNEVIRNDKGEFMGVSYSQSPLNLRLSNISFARSSYTPFIRMPITTFNATFSLMLGKEEKGKATYPYAISGYYSKSSIRSKYMVQQKKAYGYMYYQNANEDKDALLDFNRSNDGMYTLKTPVISLPVYTYDVFSISGEGTGGTFRGYRGNMGYVRDCYTRTNPMKVNLDVELGVKHIAKGGAKIGGVYSANIVAGWETENALKQVAAFKESAKMEQGGFYFKNPGESAIIDEDYYNAMGQDKLMRPLLSGKDNYGVVIPSLGLTSTLQTSFQLFNRQKKEDGFADVTLANSYRKKRDKRAQVISFFTAEEADRIGLDKYIYSYKENTFQPGTCSTDPDYKTIIRRFDDNDPDGVHYRKKHHISEITVLEGSKNYVYGLPVYQLSKKDVTFSTDETAPNDQGQITYGTGDNSTSNNKGKDNLFESETVDPYAHSFLLTAILSPDYSDLTGDGITDDDLGTAIKFNYSRVNQAASSPNQWLNMKWRMPAGQNKANFNRGLVTSNNVTRDNKALYTYGEKELWYMHSIESKNMIATFTTSNRNDGWGVQDENGGILTGSNGAREKKLDRIDLYSKADFVKYGINAKPIKTVHFVYSYELCKNYPLNDNAAIDEDGNSPAISGKPNVNANKGKLTLKSIYFTYNNNNHQKNRYRFNYSGSDIEYNSLENDRWGTYKPHSQNPGTPAISNEDYPYTIQDKTLSDANAATWSLNQILLPSGAKIDVAYEADDYAYVQDHRAAQMTKIAGFGKLPTSTPGYNLFDRSGVHAPWVFGDMDYNYIFFDVPVKVFGTTDITQLYLQDMKQLLLKLWVKIPNDGGYEPMFVYTTIDECGVVPSSGNSTTGYSRFYIKMGKAARNDGSQVMETVYQFLRDQLPAKAYPGYDLSDKTVAGQAIRSLVAMGKNLYTGIAGFENSARWSGWCQEIDPDRSVARLSNPYLKKIGGGYRVKTIKITDNFKRMLNSSAEISSVYGQQYDYTTTAIINNQSATISSGVASYEPGVGNEENPFRKMLQYNNTNPLGPTELGNIELPFAENFFPAPTIGYSRVTVRSIHNKTNNENLKSGIGMQETQFYTTKDFPVFTDYTDFDNLSRHHTNPIVNKIFNLAQRDYLTLSQGFLVVLNDMNGKIKMQASYAENDLNFKNPINKTTYFYRMTPTGDNKYQLNNVVPVVNGPGGTITNKLIGKDIEIMNDFREHFSFSHSAQIPLNVDFFSLGNYPVLIPTVFRAVFRDESMYRAASTVKIVNEYGILERVENVDKGSIVETKNLIYDAETGNVLVSQTTNEFNKPIYNFNYPAYWAYEAMGPAYKNIDATYKDLLFRNGKIEKGLTEAEANSIFESGDEIYVNDKALLGPVDNAGCIGIGSGNACTRLPKSGEYRIWAVDVTKDTRNTTKEFIFIDRYGNPYNAADADIRIIRSGRRNMTDVSVGAITSMASPILLKTDNITYDKLFVDNNTNVVGTGAVEFKEKWKTQDAFYVKDSLITAAGYAPVHSTTFYPVNDHVTKRYTDKNDPNHVLYNHQTGRNYFVSSRTPDEMYPENYTDHFFTNVKSWMLFDLFNSTNGIPSGSTCLNASLYLNSHKTTADGSGHTENIIHGTTDPLRIQTSTSTNFFYIGRLVHSWSDLGSSSSSLQNTLFTETVPYQVAQAPEFPSNIPGQAALFSNRNYNLPVTSLVRGMIQDYYDNSKNYPSAFSIHHSNNIPDGNDNSHYCFATNGSTPPPSPGDDDFPIRTYLTVKYYNCAEATSTPPGGEYVQCSSSSSVQKICTSIFSKDFINPYVQGLLGNWRPLRSYVYNGERREQDPTAATTINKNGIIKDFETFWSFDNSNLQLTRTNISSTKWVWNSLITQYNRKGAELENLDPLGRYNAGIYGYNEALPVAVVNNSRVRLSAFDGFEDYFFKDQTCNLYCNPNKRHFNTEINTSQLDETQAHTGRYSLKTAANSTTTIPVTIAADNTVTEPDINIQFTKTITNVPSVSPKGVGLKGTYYRNFDWSTTDNEVREDEVIELHCKTQHTANSSEACDESYPNNLPPDFRCGHISVKWQGSIQVQRTGSYQFYSTANDDFTEIRINGVIVFRDYTTVGGWTGVYPVNPPIPVTLTAGVLNTIEISWRQLAGYGLIDLHWKTDCDREGEQVPTINMYPLGKEYLADNTVSPNTICTKIDHIKPLSNYLIDGFNLIPGTRMISGVWVKKGTTDCHCPSYDGFTIKLKSASNSNIATLAPKGSIIEGWQLYEAEFIVPSDNKLDFYIDNGSSSQLLFIDDLRFHPYNANMKSFVYNPYNLKPAAELDENNYASFYEYDDDGTLIRVKKETKLGIKTIQETRSGLQKTITDF